MKIKFFTVLLGLFTSLNMNAQELKSFTLEDLNFGVRTIATSCPRTVTACGGATSLRVLNLTLAIL